MCLSVRDIFCGDATRCNREAPLVFRTTWSLVSWDYSGYATSMWGLFRLPGSETSRRAGCGNPHVRFDERGEEPGRRFPSVPAPLLDSTEKWPLSSIHVRFR